MRPTQILFFLLASFCGVRSQTLEPSPTESVGCEPHGDHWHCEAAATAVTDATTAAEAVITTAVEATETASIEPSPTESYGCEPHGDHWHCEGAVTALAGATTTAVEEDTETVALAPSPTESYGCEAHEDHWDCEGAVNTGAAVVGAETITSAAITSAPAEETASSTITAPETFINGAIRGSAPGLMAGLVALML